MDDGKVTDIAGSYWCYEHIFQNGGHWTYRHICHGFYTTTSTSARSTQPSTLRGMVKWVVTHVHGLRKVGTLVQLTEVA